MILLPKMVIAMYTLCIQCVYSCVCTVAYVQNTRTHCSKIVSKDIKMFKFTIYEMNYVLMWILENTSDSVNEQHSGKIKIKVKSTLNRF